MPSATAPRAAVDASEDPVDELLRNAPEGVHPELDAARRHHHDTREALRVLREMADDTARLLTEAAEERRRLSDAIADASLGEDRVESDVDEVAALEADLAALDAGIAELHRPRPRAGPGAARRHREPRARSRTSRTPPPRPWRPRSSASTVRSPTSRPAWRPRAAARSPPSPASTPPASRPTPPSWP